MAAYGAFAHGSGIKSLAMGGLSYVLAEDSYTISTNPAVLPALGNRLDIGVDVEMVRPRTTIRDNLLGPDSTSTSRGRVFPIPQIGTVRQVGEHWAVGMTGFFAGLTTDYRDSPYRRFGGDERVSVTLPQAGLSFGAAWMPVRTHAFGLSLNLGYNAVDFKGGRVFGVLSDDPARLSNQGSEGVPSAGYTIGWYGQIHPRLVAALGYRSKSYAERIHGYAGLLPDRGRLEFPAMWGGGFNWMPRRDLTVGVEYQRVEYESERMFGNGIENLIGGHKLGSRNGPGFGWRNLDIHRIGIGWKATQHFTLRAGYAHAPHSNLPSDQTFLGALAPAFAQTHYTAGVTVDFLGHWEFNLCGTYVQDRIRDGEGSIPLIVNSGPGGLIPLPLGDGEADLRADQKQFGFSIGRRF